MEIVDPKKNFLKNSRYSGGLTGTLECFIIWHTYNVEKDMHRWALVTSEEENGDIWINESHVVFIKDFESGGSMIGFSTEENDVIHTNEDSSDIFIAWDNWQEIHKDSD